MHSPTVIGSQHVTNANTDRKFDISRSRRRPAQRCGRLTGNVDLEVSAGRRAARKTWKIGIGSTCSKPRVQPYELLTGHLPIPGVVLRAQGLAGMASDAAERCNTAGERARLPLLGA